uniref:HAUS augmin-like complex subunit 3 N-terminal domain-containing protein n=1 Tax=Arion vulgaris TaxID=1028688 RepID=A0A0B7A1I8_9EUPU
MSSSNFIETLRRIGYPKADDLDPQALEWAYELDATLPFLKWFCNCVGEDNFVSASEIHEYKYIQDAGAAVSGTHLEEALHAFGDNTTEPDAQNLESDVDQLKESLTRARAQKEVLMARCNKLSIHHMTLRNRVLRMEEAEKLEAKALRRTMDACSSQNEKVTATLQSLTESVHKLIDLYSAPSGDQKEGQTENSGHFLTQCDLTAFHETEEKFSRDLTAFTKKQFFEGVSDMTGDPVPERYDLVNMSLPEKVSLSNDDNFLEDCQEFSRLQKIFPKSECDRINALVGASKALSAVNEARSILHILKSNQFPTSATEVSRLHHKVEQNIDSAKAEASSITSELPDLIRELGGLQGTEILTGDYDLKLHRQDYFIKKQDKVIEQLITQRSRNEFLIMLYELESRCHREIHHLLSAAKQVLEENLKHWKQRMKDLEDPDLSVKRLERSVVDTRDKSSMRLYHLLGESPDDDRMLYLSKQKVVEKAKLLDSQYNSAKASDKTMDEKYLTKVSQLESCVKDSMSALYVGSSTSSGQPSLSPPELQSTMAELTLMIGNLEADLAGMVTEINNKKMALKNNLLLSKEKNSLLSSTQTLIDCSMWLMALQIG